MEIYIDLQSSDMFHQESRKQTENKQMHLLLTNEAGEVIRKVGILLFVAYLGHFAGCCSTHFRFFT